MKNFGQETKEKRYAERLNNLQSAWWKKLVNVQAPYKWNLKRLNLGFVLEVGCGIGRNLKNLAGNAVGVDHNAHSVDTCLKEGFTAYIDADFATSEYAVENKFDSLLFSHVIEHMTFQESIELVNNNLRYLKGEGKVVLITPQKAGFKSDVSHKWFAGLSELEKLCKSLGLKVERKMSFPFPRFVGSFFKYNENVMVAKKNS